MAEMGNENGDRVGLVILVKLCLRAAYSRGTLRSTDPSRAKIVIFVHPAGQPDLFIASKAGVSTVAVVLLIPPRGRVVEMIFTDRAATRERFLIDHLPVFNLVHESVMCSSGRHIEMVAGDHSSASTVGDTSADCLVSHALRGVSCVHETRALDAVESRAPRILITTCRN